MRFRAMILDMGGFQKALLVVIGSSLLLAACGRSDSATAESPPVAESVSCSDDVSLVAAYACIKAWQHDVNGAKRFVDQYRIAKTSCGNQAREAADGAVTRILGSGVNMYSLLGVAQRACIEASTTESISVCRGKCLYTAADVRMLAGKQGSDEIEAPAAPAVGSEGADSSPGRDSSVEQVGAHVRGQEYVDHIQFWIELDGRDVDYRTVSKRLIGECRSHRQLYLRIENEKEESETTITAYFFDAKNAYSPQWEQDGIDKLVAFSAGEAGYNELRSFLDALSLSKKLKVASLDVLIDTRSGWIDRVLQSCPD